jgi:hypothetical protein
MLYSDPFSSIKRGMNTEREKEISGLLVNIVVFVWFSLKFELKFRFHFKARVEARDVNIVLEVRDNEHIAMCVRPIVTTTQRLSMT